MGKLSRGAALRAVDPNIIEFVEAAAVGDVRMVKKLVKAAKVEIDDGECNRTNRAHFAQKCAGRGRDPWLFLSVALCRRCKVGDDGAPVFV